MKKFSKNSRLTMLVLVFSLLLGFSPSAVHAATAPSLGALSTYGIVSETSTNSNTAPQTIVNGSVCGTTLTVPRPLIITGGAEETPCAPIKGTDQTTALGILNGQTCTSIGAAVDLNTIIIGANPPGTFPPGCYSSSGTMNIVTGTTVTLDATALGGDGGSVWIFRPGGALLTGDNSFVVLANGANSNNVFWAPVGATTLGANAAPSVAPTFVGNIFRGTAAGLSITLGHFTNLLGRTLAFGSTVTTDANTITVPTATINVVKVVVNDNGGTRVIADFPLFVNGIPVISGITNTFAIGAYAITETPDPSYTQSFSGDCDVNGNLSLATGESKFCIITNNDIAPIIPASGGGGLVLSIPVPPLIDVVKVPTPLALPNGPGPVIYTYTLRNIGTVPVTNVTMVGDTCSPIVLISGDTNNNSMLDLNEIWIYSCSTTLFATHTNTVTVTGWANGISAVDVASATVIVGLPAVSPLIHVTKIPSALLLATPGGMITYTKIVTNPGTVPLSNVRLIDDKCGPVGYVSGDTNGDSKLDVTEAWMYTCQAFLNQTTTNTVIAEGDANGMTARDLAVATVVVSIPGLPNTGFPFKENNTLLGVVGMFVILFFSYLIYKKRIV